jgi:hypothetical protein
MSSTRQLCHITDESFKDAVMEHDTDAGLEDSNNDTKEEDLPYIKLRQCLAVISLATRHTMKCLIIVGSGANYGFLWLTTLSCSRGLKPFSIHIRGLFLSHYFELAHHKKSLAAVRREKIGDDKLNKFDSQSLPMIAIGCHPTSNDLQFYNPINETIFHPLTILFNTILQVEPVLVISINLGYL